MTSIDKIVPVPQKAMVLSDHTICLGSKIVSSVNCDHPTAKTALKTLSAFLTQHVCRPCVSAGTSVYVELSDNPPAEMQNPDQGYQLTTSHERITITGFGPVGLYYGVLSLMQLAEPHGVDLFVPNVIISDWPALKTRGHFIECRYGSNLMTFEDWKNVIDTLAHQKMNQLVVGVYGCWCVQYDNRISEYFYLPIPHYPELETKVVTRYFSPTQNTWVDREESTPMFRDDFFGKLIQYGHEHGITVFPLFNSLGHNTLIPRTYPSVSAKSADGSSTGHGFCLSSDETYRVLFSIFDQIIDTYLLPNGIDSFHIGLDEVRKEIGTNLDNVREQVSPWCECEECRKYTRQENFIRHAIKLISHLKQRGMKHIYLYQDTLLTLEMPDTFVNALRDADLLDVTVIDWWSYQDLESLQSYQSLRPELGLRSTVKPWNGYYHWNVLTSSIRNNTLIMKIAMRDGAEGMQSYSAWDMSYDRTHHCQADYAWNYEGAGTEQMITKRYCLRSFGKQADLAERAFRAFDILAEPAEMIQAGNKNLRHSLQDFLLYDCAYYFYSYVHTSKPYPRNFPGEAIEAIFANRDLCERSLQRISALASVASDSFRQITVNPLLAQRYRYEFENYRCLADDYLALLRMVDLNEIGKYDEICALAKDRKKARAELMKLLESVKEKYLLSSHMRNQSVFFQFFQDLISYLDKTATPSLNFFDLRKIASDDFMRLR